MACSILGQKMDIHSGGIDLIFPHQNQVAQSQAHYDEADWAKYFIHVGHLHIKNLKMSKSLKNFITIKQLLKIVSARGLKLYFFLHRFDVVSNYDPDTSLSESAEKDKRYKNLNLQKIQLDHFLLIFHKSLQNKIFNLIKQCKIIIRKYLRLFVIILIPQVQQHIQTK